MGSPSFSPVVKKYTGNGSDTLQTIDLGYQPQMLMVYSVEGLVLLSRGAAAWHAVNGAAAAFLGAEEAQLVPSGLQLESSDDVINKNAVEYTVYSM